MNKYFFLVPISFILIAIAIILIKFFPGNNLFDFVEGLLFGFSIAINIFYIISKKKKKA